MDALGLTMAADVDPELVVVAEELGMKSLDVDATEVDAGEVGRDEDAVSVDIDAVVDTDDEDVVEEELEVDEGLEVDDEEDVLADKEDRTIEDIDVEDEIDESDDEVADTDEDVVGTSGDTVREEGEVPWLLMVEGVSEVVDPDVERLLEDDCEELPSWMVESPKEEPMGAEDVVGVGVAAVDVVVSENGEVAGSGKTGALEELDVVDVVEVNEEEAESVSVLDSAKSVSDIELVGVPELDTLELVDDEVSVAVDVVVWLADVLDSRN